MMKKSWPHKVTIIRRSCLTGKAVWIYQGPSRAAGHLAYWRAQRKEEQRIRHWAEHVKQRSANILRLLNNCMAQNLLECTLTKEQSEAARCLLALSKADAVCDMDFYEHFNEARRRRTNKL